jgi:hypothetical protein
MGCDRAPVLGGTNMSSKKQKGHGNNSSSFAKPKIVPVAEGSLQSRTPGCGPGARANEQHSLNRGSRQAENMGYQGGQYGGIASQQPRFSARQQAQRMQARAEEDRRGESRQSGWSGMEQSQYGGAQQTQVEGPGSITSSSSSASAPKQPPSGIPGKRKR